jgi:methylated-DNA-[protein]-cysteine S-methyltransferase
MLKKSPLKYTIIDTSIGKISVVSSEQGLCRISIHASRKSALESITHQFPQSIESPDGFGDLPQRLKRYAHGERIVFNDRLDLDGATLFQRTVWDATRAIPYGEFRTYEWIAQRIGKPRAARAVGQALKHNPLPIIVPCHRIIGKDGSLTGFSAGIELKKLLLELEASSHAKNRAR